MCLYHPQEWYYVSFSFLFVLELSNVQSVSQRKIYTLFTQPKTWNEAHDICESQFGQLVKVRVDRGIAELKYLDETEWGNKVNAS